MTSKWVSPNFPKGLYEELEAYALSEDGQKQGFNSGKDVLVDLGRKFMKEYNENNIKKIKK